MFLLCIREMDVQWREFLHQYIGGIVRKRKQQMIAIGGTHDHVHLLVSMNPTVSPSDLMADVKRASSKWINEKHLVPGHFAWQEEFGAFSYAKSLIDNVIRYIQNQEEHHRKQSFREKYVDFLKSFGVEYDERYIFITYNREPYRVHLGIIPQSPGSRYAPTGGYFPKALRAF